MVGIFFWKGFHHYCKLSSKPLMHSTFEMGMAICNLLFCTLKCKSLNLWHPLIQIFYERFQNTAWASRCLYKLLFSRALNLALNRHNKYQIPNTKYKVLNKYKLPNTKYQITNTIYKIPKTKYHINKSIRDGGISPWH